MTTILLDDPAPPDQRITELHVWIATHRNGSEGIMGGGSDLPVPLITHKRDVAEALGGMARQAMILSRDRGPTQVTRIRMATFRLVE